MNTQKTLNFVECVLPEESLKWFNIVKSEMDDKDIKVILEEKNLPPTK